jgi:hypothetical protein
VAIVLDRSDAEYDRGVPRGRIRLLLGLLFVLLAVPAVALADAVATTGDATSVSTTAAELNGVIDPPYSDSAWFFEYATSPDLSRGATVTQVTPTGSGLRAVSVLVGNLEPKTTYYFRLGVTWQADTTQGPSGRFGQTKSFTTPARAPRLGHVFLPVARARLRGATIPVRLGCRGPAGAVCAVAVGLSVRAAGSGRGPAGGRGSAACGTGVFVAYAPRLRTVALHPTPACRRAIRRSRGRRLTAQLRLVVYPARTTLERRLTLTG